MRLISLILLAVTATWPVVGQSSPATKFDSYNYLVTGDDEAARLEAFVEALRTNPSVIGYLIGYNATTTPPGVLRRRLYGDKRYLIEARGVEPNRLVLIEGGYRGKVTTEIWLAPKGSPAPTPSPTRTSPSTNGKQYLFDEACVECEAPVNLDLNVFTDGLKFYAAELQRMSHATGLIVITQGARSRTRAALAQARRAKRILAREYNIAPNRIHIQVGHRRKDNLVFANMWIVPRRSSYADA